ncbi:MAG: cell filamentation protein Fic [Desulfuromonadaceae bacterium GWB2_53_15]|nr:MAG: cell filamentation protein Fic [Desulfuromonadales bacterium GWD2_54_10]OHB25848.1 MAG: cell filamentation protein Fic [Desulfuromonadaceae bacterium GWB2_53_15]
MSKQIKPEEFDVIIRAVGLHPNGAGVDSLLTHLGIDLSHRTLQRRLAKLVASGRLVTEGAGRALRYKIRSITADLVIAPDMKMEASLESYIPLSPEGSEIRNHVRQPRQMRQPIGYNPEFLATYHPNETFYLTEGLRSQLRKIGTFEEVERPAGTFARDILTRLLIDLSWASSQLEGNTYSRLDTERLIEFGQVAEGKDAVETQMILNHKAAIELLVSEAGQIGFDRTTILNLHALLSDGLMVDPRACGRIRERLVEIGGSVYLPIAMSQRLDELFTVILDMATEIADPFEQAFFIMVHLPYLQPFEDVNKRTSRLAANIPLIRHNLCPLSFIDVPARAYIDAMLGVYELQRIELLRDVFVWAYERSCQQYLAVQRQLVPPDSFRLRYRKELTSAIKSMVSNHWLVTEEAARLAVPATVPETDRDHFVQMVLDELDNLYEGNALRFGLRPLEVAAWREAIDKHDGARM